MKKKINSEAKKYLYVCSYKNEHTYNKYFLYLIGIDPKGQMV